MTIAEWWAWFGPGWVALAAASVALALPGTLWWAAGRGLAAAAVPQAALVGAAVGLLLGYSRDQLVLPAAVAAAVAGVVVPSAGVAAVLTVGLALPVLLVSGSPHGMNEVTDLTLSRVLGLGWNGAWPSVGLAVIGILLAWWGRRPLRAAVLDGAWAASAGLHPAWWSRLLGLWGGVAIGAALPAIGLIGVIGFLVLPGLGALRWCRTLGAALVLAPVIALLGVTLALPTAHAVDLPPVPVAVILTALAAGVIALAGRRR